MMTRDADGWFTYHGRADDLLKVSGKWFSPRELAFAQRALAVSLQHSKDRSVPGKETSASR